MSYKRHLVTSALPYINGVKHLGNLVGSMLPADVYARFLRQKGEEVIYICATDDHGTPAEIAAHKAGLSVKEFCDQSHNTQKEIYEGFALKFDHFGRTSSQQNAALTQHFCAKLKEEGFIEEKSDQQLYSIDDERYLPDRYVEGTCPHCGFEGARGDECEGCGKQMEPTELLNPRSSISGSTNIEVRETRHLYIKLSELDGRVRDWLDTRHDFSSLARAIGYKWLDEGLHDRCITRDLKWGVSVDQPGYEGKVFYVWFDAPIGYIGATQEWAEKTGGDWESFWKKPEEVYYTQFMAKDNVSFHTINFPATQLGSGETWKTVDNIKAFNWLTYYGGKFSTSRNHGIFTDKALELLPADYWRYYLMARAPESDDSSFTWADMQGVINKDLADVLGNYVNRLLKFTAKKFDGKVPEAGTWSAAEDKFLTETSALLADYNKHLANCEFRKAMSALRALWVAGNQYLAEQEPWSVFKEDEARAATILRTAFNFLSVIARLSEVVIPFTTEKLQALIHEQDKQGTWVTDMEAELKREAEDRTFEAPSDVLIQKIEDEQIAEFEGTFGSEAA